MNHKTLICGLSTHVPGLFDAIIKIRNSSSGGAAKSARYCYSVWLRHLVMAKNNNLIQKLPGTVAELGPGDSLGVGLCALLSGSTKYYALDIVPHASPGLNLSILHELVKFFQDREPVPDDIEWPDLYPKLNSYEFPKDILSDGIIDAALKPERIDAIKNALANPDACSSDIEIHYCVPWNSVDIIKKNSVDLIVSQAVMEHIEELDEAYSAMYQWLHVGGVMSMEIDFSNHVMADAWNDQWRYSDFIWNTIIWGKRPYSLNREPHSTHLTLIHKNNFKIVCDIPQYDHSGINRTELDKKFEYISDDDLCIKNSFVQGTKN